ncbi:MAG: tetratricopeptide repeat protein [Acidobacteria bacterium]|nr:tetratricopeptide repeat protein [Acidobacteriota bacterium]
MMKDDRQSNARFVRRLAGANFGGQTQVMGNVIGVAAYLLFSAVPVFAQADDLAAKAQRGKELMARERFEEAIPIYRDLVRALPNIPGPVTNLGIALHMAGNDREAVKQFEAALKIDPSYLPALLYVGSTYLSLARTDKAIQSLEKVLRIQPDNDEARQLLGDAFLSLERFEAAAEQFARMSERNPSNPKAWSGLGRCYEGLAQQSFEKLTKIALGSAYWLVLVAETHARAEQADSAFYFYREALAKMSSLRGVHRAVSEIYRKTGHPDWATVEEERERTLPPLDCIVGERASPAMPGADRSDAASSSRLEHDWDARRLECDFWAGRYRELIASARDGKTAESYFWRSRAYERLAAQAFGRLAQLPRSAEAHELLARIHFRRKRCLEAAKEWRQAVELSPGSIYYRKELAISLGCGGDLEGAQNLLEDLVKRSPNSAEVNYWLGFTLLGLHKGEQAIAFLRKVIEINPADLTAQRDLARAYLEVGQTEQAIPHLKAALPIDREGDVYYQLARAYQSIREQELATQMFEKFRELQDAAAAEEQAIRQRAEITPP